MKTQKEYFETINNSEAEWSSGDSFLVILDVDHLMPFNDAMGQRAGDDFLAKFSDFCADLTNGHTFRLGGDEFALIIKKDCLDKSLGKIQDYVRSIGTFHHPELGEGCLGPTMVVTDDFRVLTEKMLGEELRNIISAAKLKGRNSVYRMNELRFFPPEGQ